MRIGNLGVLEFWDEEGGEVEEVDVEAEVEDWELNKRSGKEGVGGSMEVGRSWKRSFDDGGGGPRRSSGRASLSAIDEPEISFRE